MLTSSLLRSGKLRMCNHQQKWAYLCVHLTPVCEYVGVFRYPLALWADEANVKHSDISGIVGHLAKVGLIEFDGESEMVRIVGLFRNTPPKNASHATGLLKDFSYLLVSEPDQRAMVLRGISELVVATVQRAQRWNPEKPDYEKLTKSLMSFLSQAHQEIGDDLTLSLASELKASARTVRSYLEGIFPPLAECDFSLPGKPPHENPQILLAQAQNPTSDKFVPSDQAADTVFTPCDEDVGTMPTHHTKTKKIQKENQGQTDNLDEPKYRDDAGCMTTAEKLQLDPKDEAPEQGSRIGSVTGPFKETANSDLARAARQQTDEIGMQGRTKPW